MLFVKGDGGLIGSADLQRDEGQLFLPSPGFQGRQQSVGHAPPPTLRRHGDVVQAPLVQHAGKGRVAQDGPVLFGHQQPVRPPGEQLFRPGVGGEAYRLQGRHGGDVFLDDVRIRDVEEALQVPVTVTGGDGFSLVDAIFELEP